MLLLKVKPRYSLIYKFCNIQNTYQSIRRLSATHGDKNITEALSSQSLPHTGVNSLYLPEPPIVSDIIESTLEYNSLGEATFQSLGLNSYWPTGWIQSAFETLHVSLDIPWWGVIAISAITTRLLMMPFSIRSRRLNLSNSQVTPVLGKLEKKLKDSMLLNDYMTVARISQEYVGLAKGEKFTPYKSMFYTTIQFPIFISIMMGLREMASLPVASLQTGGVLWFTDLSLPDPYYILPICTMVLFWLQIELGADMATNSMSSSPFAKWAVRAIPVVGAVFTCNFPSALLLYWWCSSALSLIFVGLMKFLVVKRLFQIETPQKLPEQPQTTDSSKFGFIKEWKQKSAERQVYDKAKNVDAINHEQWIKASSGAVPKTFAYDPTKVKTS